MAKAPKYVYLFGNGKADGDGSMKALLGGKGANLAEMARIGLPVPPGFTITTEVCTYYYAHKKTYPKDLEPQVRAGMAHIEKIMGTKFGDTKALPLLVSVRSGARDSMPGMMDTILNLGLNDQTVHALARATNNERFAWDCYRRFVQMYGDVVMGVQKRSGEDHEPFESVLHQLKHERYGADIEDTKLTVDDLKELVNRFKALIKERTGGKEFPQDPWKQLWGAIGAVFGSWMNDRAIVYRRKYNIPHDWGTAVNVQAMVYGNTGERSGSGVAFTRNPANGEKEFYGEFLINAQGEDVVAGIRTPEPVVELKKHLPEAYKELERIRTILEKHFKDVQDFEFTIQDGKVFMLQTRNGKRTALAALKFSIDMVKEKLIDWKTAIRRNPADQFDQLLAPIFDANAEKAAEVIATGLPAGPGAASGKMYLSWERAVAAAQKGEKVLLVRNETTPEDLRGMIAAEGILTAKGGVSSHAALVARQMGKVCVCGASALQLDYEARTLTVNGRVFKEGDWLSINGTLGNVYAGQIPTAPSEIVQVLINKTLDPKASKTYQMFKTLMDWCSKVTRLEVRTNADTPGHTPSETTINESFARVFASAQGRIIVATFASNISRIQQVIDAAVRYQRKVTIIGRSMQDNVKMALQLGYLHAPEDILIRVDQLHRYAQNEIVIVCTGGQGEPTSALVRMANHDHKQVSIVPGDTVILSATPIPGNEEMVNRTIDNLFRAGAFVYYSDLMHVHVSGHASQEEQKLLINLLRPKYLIPMHGEYRHLVLHARLAQALGIPADNIFIVENGAVVEFDENGHARVARDKVPASDVLVDGIGVGDVGTTVLRERHHLSEDGFLVAVLTLDAHTGEVVFGPEIVTHGFVYLEQAEEIITGAKEVLLGAVKKGGRGTALSAKLKEVLGHYLYQQTHRRPMVIPVVTEV